MTFDPSCKHDKGVYLCDTPNDKDYWAMWCCSLRCGTAFAKHPVTGMSYPRKANTKPGQPLAEEGKRL